jgi:DNA-binding beta-propeller fold protein YncE
MALLIVGTVAASGGEQASPRFTGKPKAVKVANGSAATAKVKITFAVDRETDVAVFIEDGEGKVVRHLVAGVLGDNPPPPLEPGLSQSIEWDGKADYGRPVSSVASAGGGFKVRVALGMDARYDKVLLSDNRTTQGINGLAAGPDGTLYVLTKAGGSVWGTQTLLAFNREGSYQRTVMPFGSDMKLDQVKAFGAFELEGRTAALVHDHRLGLYPMPGSPRKTVMAVTPDGKVLLKLTGGGRYHRSQHITAVGTDGSAAWANPSGPAFLTPAAGKGGKVRYGGYASRPMMAISTDGKTAYLSGLNGKFYAKAAIPAVYKVPLPSRAGAKVFFGDPAKTGKGKELLGSEARGLAVDGKGHLLISDPANGRVVVVDEADGKHVAEMKVAKPDCLAVNSKTGEVYVLNLTGKGSAEVLKFSGWKNARKLASIPVKAGGNPAYPPVMVADCSARPAVIWTGSDDGVILRIEDGGAKFSDAVQINKGTTGNYSFLDLTVDRFRKEVYARCAHSVSTNWWYRFNEEGGKVEKVGVPLSCSGGGRGGNLMAGLDDHLYAMQWPMRIYKLDRKGKPVAWEEGIRPKSLLGKGGKQFPIKSQPAHISAVPVSETGLPHGMGIRGDGHIFIFAAAHCGNRPPKSLHEYLPTGKQLTDNPIIWKVSDAAVGPRFDAQGNIYVAEYVRPKGRHYPDELVKALGPMKKRENDGLRREAASMYGSILKFGPTGGMVHIPADKKVPEPYRGTPKLDASMNTISAEYFSRGDLHPVKVTGAEWMRFGVSHIGVQSCTCENITFDVDEFGRVFHPDTNRYRVTVLDTAGNEIAHFGNYGNAESCGPDSPVVDPKTGKVRPRKPGEKLESPFAKPEIAFSWLVGVGATDKYIYCGDSINRRMLRLKLTYAAEETVPVQ